jgi:fumarate hydratase class II
VETGGVGPIEVARGRYRGPRTKRSRQNFRIHLERIPLSIIRPNDPLNTSRSSNDSFPIATRITADLRIVQELVPAPGELHGVLWSNAKAFPPVGRGAQRTRLAVAELYPLTQRGSAIGSSLNPRSSFACLFVRHVASSQPASSKHVHPATRSSSRTAPFPLRGARKTTARLPLMAAKDIAS